jgi:hypothetical protein
MDDGTQKIVGQISGTPTNFEDVFVSQLIVGHCDFVVDEIQKTGEIGSFVILDNLAFPHNVEILPYYSESDRYKALLAWITEHSSLPGVTSVTVEIANEKVTL